VTPILRFVKNIDEAIVSLHRPPKSCDEATQFIYFSQISIDEEIVSLLSPHRSCDEAIVPLLKTHEKIVIGSLKIGVGVEGSDNWNFTHLWGSATMVISLPGQCDSCPVACPEAGVGNPSLRRSLCIIFSLVDWLQKSPKLGREETKF